MVSIFVVIIPTPESITQININEFTKMSSNLFLWLNLNLLSSHLSSHFCPYSFTFTLTMVCFFFTIHIAQLFVIEQFCICIQLKIRYKVGSFENSRDKRKMNLNQNAVQPYYNLDDISYKSCNAILLSYLYTMNSITKEIKKKQKRFT